MSNTDIDEILIKTNDFIESFFYNINTIEQVFNKKMNDVFITYKQITGVSIKDVNLVSDCRNEILTIRRRFKTAMRHYHRLWYSAETKYTSMVALIRFNLDTVEFFSLAADIYKSLHVKYDRLQSFKYYDNHGRLRDLRLDFNYIYSCLNTIENNQKLPDTIIYNPLVNVVVDEKGIPVAIGENSEYLYKQIMVLLYDLSDKINNTTTPTNTLPIDLTEGLMKMNENYVKIINETNQVMKGEKAIDTTVYDYMNEQYKKLIESNTLAQNKHMEDISKLSNDIVAKFSNELQTATNDMITLSSKFDVEYSNLINTTQRYQDLYERTFSAKMIDTQQQYNKINTKLDDLINRSAFTEQDQHALRSLFDQYQFIHDNLEEIKNKPTLTEQDNLNLDSLFIKYNTINAKLDNLLKKPTFTEQESNALNELIKRPTLTPDEYNYFTSLPKQLDQTFKQNIKIVDKYLDDDHSRVSESLAITNATLKNDFSKINDNISDFFTTIDKYFNESGDKLQNELVGAVKDNLEEQTKQINTNLVAFASDVKQDVRQALEYTTNKQSELNDTILQQFKFINATIDKIDTFLGDDKKIKSLSEGDTAAQNYIIETITSLQQDVASLTAEIKNLPKESQEPYIQLVSKKTNEIVKYFNNIVFVINDFVLKQRKLTQANIGLIRKLLEFTNIEMLDYKNAQKFDTIRDKIVIALRQNEEVKLALDDADEEMEEVAVGSKSNKRKRKKILEE